MSCAHTQIALFFFLLLKNDVYVVQGCYSHTCLVTSNGPNLISMPSVLVEVMMPLTKDGLSKLSSLRVLVE